MSTELADVESRLNTLLSKSKALGAKLERMEQEREHEMFLHLMRQAENAAATVERERIVQIIKEEYGATMAGYEGPDWIIALIEGEAE